jgi:hypothetical protein
LIGPGRLRTGTAVTAAEAERPVREPELRRTEPDLMQPVFQVRNACQNWRSGVAGARHARLICQPPLPCGSRCRSVCEGPRQSMCRTYPRCGDGVIRSRARLPPAHPCRDAMCASILYRATQPRSQCKSALVRSLLVLKARTGVAASTPVEVPRFDGPLKSRDCACEASDTAGATCASLCRGVGRVEAARKRTKTPNFLCHGR